MLAGHSRRPPISSSGHGTHGNEAMIAAAVLAALAAAAPAQQQFAEIGTRGIPPNNADTQAVVLGDVDGDGDLDMVAGNNSRNRLYLNDGNGNYTDVTATHLPNEAGGTEDIVLGDVDGDNDLDMVIANHGSQNHLYLNDGNGVYTDVTQTRMPTEQENTYAVALGDVDGDGDLDIAFGNAPYPFSSSGQELLYLNNGDGFFTDVTVGQMPTDANVTFDVTLGDVDDDGDLDMVLGIASSGTPPNPSQNKLYLNNGNGVFTDATAGRMPIDSDVTAAVALGDVDGDGDLDLVCGNWYYGQQDRIYLNNGSGEFTDVTGKLMPINTDRTAAVSLGDADGDGDLDLVLATFGQPTRQNRLYLNNGTGDFHDMTSTRMPEDDDETTAVALGDVDGDGDLDIVFGNRPGSVVPIQDRLYLNDGSATFVEGSTVRMPDNKNETHALALGDVDGDGDLDVVLGNQAGNAFSSAAHNRLHINDGDGSFTDETSTRMPLAGGRQTSALVLGDVDGDGDLDMVAGNSQVQNRLHLNDGTGIYTDATPGRMPVDSDRTTAVALGDIDDDGDLDMVCGNCPIFVTPGPNRLYVNDGTGFFIDATAARLPADVDNTASLALGDVDGDGDLDIVLGNAKTPFVSPGQQNRLYLNDGFGFFTDATGTRMPTDSDYTHALALGDVDGDGDLDLVLGNTYLSWAQNKLYLNDGSGTFSDATAARLPARFDDTVAVALGDVDNDGDLDILFGNRHFVGTGQNHLYLNDGTGTFTDATTPRMPETGDMTAAVALGDVDRDGDLDVLVANYSDLNSNLAPNRLYLNLLRQLDAPRRLRIGDTYTLDAYARYGPPSTSDIAVPFLSGGRATIPFPPLGTIGIDPLTLVALPPFLIPQPAGMGSLVRPIPNVPSLVGASIHAQAVLVQNPFPARLTNVVGDTVIQ